MKSKFNKFCISLIATFLSAIQVSTLIPAQAFETLSSSSVMNPLIRQSITSLAPGIQESRLTFTNPQGYRTECFGVDVDLSGQKADILAGTPNDGNSYSMQTVRDQANAAIKNGKKVIAAVNGDYYNMATGEPQGTVIKNGTEIHANKASECFFGIKKDGTPVIGDAATYSSVKGNLKEAISGPRLLVKNGIAQSYDSIMYPCTAVGVRSDNTVFFLCIDGAQYPYSTGIRLTDLAELLVEEGAYQALMLDGGGSSTYVSRTPGETGLTCKNSPSDGHERKVANSLLIVSNSTADGNFSSAYVTPHDKTYSPNSVVQMNAAGLDQSGAPASLPASGLKWSLSDSSFGTIDGTGLLTSSGKTGSTQVNLSYNDQIVGSTGIEFAIPNDIHFLQSSLSLKLNSKQDLGLVSRYQGRDVILHQGDIQWNIDPKLGTVDEHNILATSDTSFTGTVTVGLSGTKLSASIKLIVGQMPVVLYDFENGLDDWAASTAGRGEISQISLSNDADFVRFGKNSLKIDFDCTKAQKGTTLGIYAGPSASKDIPGMPTAIGAWVYATPEAKGYWLRMYLYDSSSGSIQKPINFTDEGVGINWTGWKYVEAPIPSNYVGPFKTFPKQMIRMMSLKSGNPGPMTKGSIYVDNVRVVYGATNDDNTLPIINSVNIDGKAYTQNQVDITASVKDDLTDKYATGINWNTSILLVDGVDYSKDKTHFSYSENDGTLNIKGMNWANGVHKVTVDIHDNFGNEAKKDVYFKVDTDSGPRLQLTQSAEQAQLGQGYQLSLCAENASELSAVNAKIQLTPGFPVSGVVFEQSVQNGSSYTYDPNTGMLNLSINTSNVTKDQTGLNLAAIAINVPKGTLSGSKLTYSMEKSSATYKADQGANFSSTFSSEPKEINVVSTYVIKMLNSIVGKDGKILVTDQAGLAVPDAKVTMESNGTLVDLGLTDQNGILVSSKITSSLQKVFLQAEKDGKFSFPFSAQSYNPAKNKVPSNILLGTTEDPTTEKSITWMSNPLESADPVIEYAKSTQYEADKENAFQQVSGTSVNLGYDSDSWAVKENSVEVTGLDPGTEYTYRVGDGTNWSEVQKFTTDSATNQFSFNVFGDTQSTDAGGLDDLSKVLTQIENSSNLPLFSIHVGDFVDDEQVFSQIDNTLQMLNSHKTFNSIDEIHVLGNHEYQGDDGTKGSTIYGTPHNGPVANKNGCYSTNYGNMHISVIGWTDSEATMNEELKWLRNDVRAANKTWNIVATHQPSYNKNPADSNSIMNRLLPPVCDQLGIDIVFSGHDHSYGRTYPLVDGKKVDNGTVYISAGHTAEKTYDIDADSKIFEYAQSDKETKTYITGSVDDKNLTITAYNMDGTVIDTYKLTAKDKIDKTALEGIISNAESLKESDYTLLSWSSFQTTLQQAKQINDNFYVSADDVKKAEDSLKNAVQNLQLLATESDKSSLKALIEQTEGLQEADYTPNSWVGSELKAALENAVNVYDNSTATESEVSSAFSKLETAMSKLVPIATETDREILRSLIEQSKGIYKDNYTPDSWSNFQSAIEIAQSVYEKDVVSADEVTEAIGALEAARSKLVLAKADKSALQTAIAVAEEFQTGTDSSKYTPNSWTALQNAIEAAKSVCENPNATVEQVTDTLAGLEAAKSGLELQSIQDAENKIDDLPQPGDGSLAPDQKTSIAAVAERVTSLQSDEKLTLDPAKVGKLEALLSKTVNFTVNTSINGIPDEQQIKTPTISNPLLAVGITGGESNKPAVKLEVAQLPQGTNTSVAIALEVTLTRNGVEVHDLKFPVTVSFTLPSSFDGTKHYMVIHHKHDGTVEELPLIISGTTGSFTTTSLSEFEVSSGVSATGITLDKTSLALTNSTKTGQLIATVSPADAADKTIVWSSSNASIATVDTKGKVTAKSNGTAVITAKTQNGAYSANCTVTVTGFHFGSSSIVTFVSDTNADFSVSGAYQFKITSTNATVPVFVVGTPGIFDYTLVKTIGNDYYYKITVIGAIGTKAGIYVNGTKLLVATVGADFVSDTTRPLSVKKKESYVFKLTANSKPKFVAGTPSAFKTEFVKVVGKDYFFKVTAIAKAGAGCGFYINSQKTPVTVATISK